MLWQKCSKIRPDDGASVVVGRRATTCPRSAGKPHIGPRDAEFSVVSMKEEHTVHQPNAVLTTRSKRTLKAEVTFDKLFQKLYNVEFWLLAYQRMAPKPGNMTPGVDGKTIDGTGLKLIQEAIYEPTFSDHSQGFRPERSCHTALATVKRDMNGVRWWVEGDIKGYFDNVNHETLLRILSKRITDKRFLHLIGQFLKAGYVEDWRYPQTYSGVPQGGALSPVLSNIYLNELDRTMATQIAEFNRGKARLLRREYNRLRAAVGKAKKKARVPGDGQRYQMLQTQMLQTEAKDPMDPDFRRMYYVRYADDFLGGINGNQAEAEALKMWLGDYLRNDLQLELSGEKTLVTSAKKRVRFLGYDIKRCSGNRILRYHRVQGVKTRRTGTDQLSLLMPPDKTIAFAKEYGETTTWQGQQRNKRLNLSELEILMTYNAEGRGFLGYYSLADNLKDAAGGVL